MGRMGAVGLLALPPELCVHWSRIEYPNGPISIGRCKKCGREREYENHRFPQYNVKPLSEKYTPPPKRTEDWDD